MTLSPETIKNGIAVALHEEFGDDVTIYSENVPQGLSEPCFTIKCLTFRKKRLVNRRYRLETLFVVTYFPQSEYENDEFYDAEERIFSALETISADGDLIHQSNFQVENSDGVLVITLNYNGTVFKPSEQTFMDGISFGVSAKE